jgi:hypothetical protein
MGIMSRRRQKDEKLSAAQLASAAKKAGKPLSAEQAQEVAEKVAEEISAPAKKKGKH